MVVVIFWHCIIILIAVYSYCVVLIAAVWRIQQMYVGYV